MPVIDVPQPEFMEDEEIAIFADAVGKFYQQHAPEKRVQKWRDDGQVWLINAQKLIAAGDEPPHTEVVIWEPHTEDQDGWRLDTDEA